MAMAPIDILNYMVNDVVFQSEWGDRQPLLTSLPNATTGSSERFGCPPSAPVCAAMRHVAIGFSTRESSLFVGDGAPKSPNVGEEGL